MEQVQAYPGINAQKKGIIWDKEKGRSLTEDSRGNFPVPEEVLVISWHRVNFVTLRKPRFGIPYESVHACYNPEFPGGLPADCPSVSGGSRFCGGHDGGDPFAGTQKENQG